MRSPVKAPKTVYIVNGVCNQIKPEWPIDWYQLESRATLSEYVHDAIRIKTPDDMQVYKVRQLGLTGAVIGHYFTSADNRSLDSLDWEPVVRINGKWVTRYDFKHLKSFTEYAMAMKAEGYIAVPELGYLSPEQYQKWSDKWSDRIQRHHRDKILGVKCL